jgi:hypothetical protein
VKALREVRVAVGPSVSLRGAQYLGDRLQVRMKSLGTGQERFNLNI